MYEKKCKPNEWSKTRPYDVESLMTYQNWRCSKDCTSKKDCPKGENGKYVNAWTGEVKGDPAHHIGQRRRLTEWDIKGLNAVYCGEKPGRKTLINPFPTMGPKCKRAIYDYTVHLT